MCVESGYKTMTHIQLCNGLSAFEAREITLRALRVYLACFALVAVREAAARARKRSGRRGEAAARYRVDELQRFLGGDRTGDSR